MTFQDGINLFKSEDYSAAAEHFHQVTQENEKNHKAWNALGTCLSRMSMYEEANTCFTNAIKLDPDNDTYKKNIRKNQAYLKEEDIFFLDDYQDINQKINENRKSEQISGNKNKIQQKNNNSPYKRKNPLFWVLCLLLLFIPFGRLITIYLVYRDVKKIGVGNPNATDTLMRWSPKAWAGALLLPLLPIIFLLYYSYKRDEWCTEKYSELGYHGPYSKSIIFWIYVIILAFIGFIIIASVFLY